MKEAPINFTAVWHRGDFSIGEVYSRKIVNGFPLGGSYHREKYIRDEEHQLPEKAFQELWTFAIALCGMKPDHVISYYRQDREEDVSENDNNRPFILDSSPRYSPGAEVKDIRYEGTIYHSDPRDVRRFEGRDYKRPEPIQIPHPTQTRTQRRRGKKH